MSTLKTNNIQHVDRSDPSIIISTDGGVSIAGTLTYEDVTNVDSVGIITAGKQLHVGTGVSIAAGGLNVTAGITTVQALQATTGTFTGNITGGGNITATSGTLTAASLVGTTVTSGSLTCSAASAFGGEMSIADKISHVGDSDTAIRFPSADKITFETAAVQRVSIGATGYVGIGSDNPRQQLTIQNNTQHCLVRVISAADNESGIDFGDADDGDQGKVRYNNTGNFMRFETGATERLRIDSNGKICVSHTNALHSGNLQVSTSNSDAIDINAYSTTAANGGRLTFYRSKNASIGSNTIVADNDSLGRIDFRGYNLNGNAYNIGATIETVVDGTVDSTTDMPSALTFGTSAEGSSTPTTRLTINQAGNATFTGIVTATEFVPTVSRLSHRNLIINGDMRIAQRGTSSTSDGYHTVDRFAMKYGGENEAPTGAQVDITSNDPGPYADGFSKAFRITNGNQTGGADSGDYMYLSHKIEAQNLRNSGWYYTSTSNYVTLSFWVKSSVAQTFYGYLRTFDGTAQLIRFEFGLSADTWKKVVVKIPGAANIQFDDNNGVGLELVIATWFGTSYTAHSGDTPLGSWAVFASGTRMRDMTSTWYTTNDAQFEITGIQLEPGTQATPFEFKSFAEEKRLCDRYYQKIKNTSSGKPFGVGNIDGSTQAQIYVSLPVEMREAPSSMELANNSTDFAMRVRSSVTCTGHNFFGAGSHNVFLEIQVSTGHGFTDGHAAFAINNGANLFIAFSAEL